MVQRHLRCDILQLLSKWKQPHTLSCRVREPKGVQVKRPGWTAQRHIPTAVLVLSSHHHPQKLVEICRVNHPFSGNLFASPVISTLAIIILSVCATLTCRFHRLLTAVCLAADRTDPTSSGPIARDTDIAIGMTELGLSIVKDLGALAQKLPFLGPAANIILRALIMRDVSASAGFQRLLC
jgi:hypothetical protein